MSDATRQQSEKATTFPRQVRLPDGREVTVRFAEKSDIDGIEAMYDEMSDEDRYLRFFTPHRPDRSLFEREVAANENGGAALVAEVNEDGTTEIIGDVWYSMLPDGDGEFAIAVAEPWRGWLGAYLLDTLLDLAAERGVSNLQAEILLGNRPMLSIVRRRGSVLMADDGPSVRVVVGSGGRPASWPPRRDRPRVLVEGCRGTRSIEVANRAGLDVIQCPGPGDHSCPYIDEGTCPLVEGADAIVISLPSNDEGTRSLLRAHRELRPDIPVFIDGATDDTMGELSTEVFTRKMSDHEVVSRIIRALTHGEDR